MQTTGRHTSSHHITSHHITSHHITSHHITSPYLCKMLPHGPIPVTLRALSVRPKRIIGRVWTMHQTHRTKVILTNKRRNVCKIVRTWGRDVCTAQNPVRTSILSRVTWKANWESVISLKISDSKSSHSASIALSANRERKLLLLFSAFPSPPTVPDLSSQMHECNGLWYQSNVTKIVWLEMVREEWPYLWLWSVAFALSAPGPAVGRVWSSPTSPSILTVGPADALVGLSGTFAPSSCVLEKSDRAFSSAMDRVSTDWVEDSAGGVQLPESKSPTRWASESSTTRLGSASLSISSPRYEVPIA